MIAKQFNTLVYCHMYDNKIYDPDDDNIVIRIYDTYVDEESDHRITLEVPGASGVTVDLFDPLDGNWGCELLTESREAEVDELLSETGPLNEFADEFGRDFNDRYSCDSVLDVDLDGSDGLINFLQQQLAYDRSIARVEVGLINESGQ